MQLRAGSDQGPDATEMQPSTGDCHQNRSDRWMEWEVPSGIAVRGYCVFRKVGLLVVVGLLLSGCSLTSTKTVAPASQRSLDSLLLTLRDLPSGWLPSATPRAGLCAAPAPPSSLVGHNGVAVAFQHNGGEPLLIEYLLRTSKPINAMGRAMEQVASQASCSETDRGRITRKSVNVGIIETPTFGDWSVATKDQIFGNGGIPNLGTSSYGSRASFLQWRTRTLEVLN